MNHTFSAPVTAAQRQRDTLLGALVGLARSTVNEPKTEDTDRVLAAGLRLAAEPNAVESALLRMTDIVEAEKHRVAPTALPVPCPAETPAIMTLPVCGRTRRNLCPESSTAFCCLRPCRTKNDGTNPEGDLRRSICAGRGLGHRTAAAHRHTGRGTVRPVTFPETKKHFLPENEPFFTKPLYKCAAKNYYIVICCCLMQSFSTGAFRYYSHTQDYMRKKVESMSVKRPSFLPLQKLPQPRQSPHARPQSPLSKRRKPPKRKRPPTRAVPRFPLRSTLNLPASSITSPILWTAPRPITV